MPRADGARGGPGGGCRRATTAALVLLGSIGLAACNRDSLDLPPLGPDLGAGVPVDACADSALSCAAPLGACNGVCVDRQSDDRHCGACGHSCGAGIRCVAGVCETNACPGLLGLPGPPLILGLGSRVAAGDLDGDGRLDLIGVDWGFARRALRLPGGWFGDLASFPSRTYLDIEEGPNLLVVDLDGDGALDVATLAGNRQAVEVLRGDGHGGLGAPIECALPSAQLNGLAVGDFNRDGRVDLATANFSGGGAGVVVIDGLGGGRFGPPRLSGSGGQGPTSIATADFDGDGQLDLVTGSLAGQEVTVMLGRGDGTFRGGTDVKLGIAVFAVVPADYDGDGRVDLAALGVTSVSAGSPSQVAVLPNQGKGSFGPRSFTFLTGGYDARWMATTDLDRDGHPDLVVALADRANLDGSSVATLRNDGQGGFPEARLAVELPHAVHLATGDLDGDGWPDVVLGHDSGDATVLLNDHQGALVAARRIGVGADPSALVAADLDGDGRIDLATHGDSTDDVTVSWNAGGGDFTASAFGIPQGGIGRAALLAADLDADGRADLVVASHDEGGVRALLGRGGQGFLPTVQVGALPGVGWLGAGDLDADGRPELVLHADGERSLVLLRNGSIPGVASFADPVRLALPFLPGDAALADVNGDARPDLVVIDASDGARFAVLLGCGALTFGQPRSYRAGSNLAGSFLTLADADGDGDLDVTVGNSRAGGVSIALNLGDGTFGPASDLAVPGTPARLVVADVNGDGRPDLAGPTARGTVVVLPGTPLGFGPPLHYPGGLAPVAIAAADLDGDHRQDLAVLSSRGGLSLRLLFSLCLP